MEDMLRFTDALPDPRRLDACATRNCISIGVIVDPQLQHDALYLTTTAAALKALSSTYRVSTLHETHSTNTNACDQGCMQSYDMILAVGTWTGLADTAVRNAFDKIGTSRRITPKGLSQLRAIVLWPDATGRITAPEILIDNEQTVTNWQLGWYDAVYVSTDHDRHAAVAETRKAVHALGTCRSEATSQQHTTSDTTEERVHACVQQALPARILQHAWGLPLQTLTLQTEPSHSAEALQEAEQPVCTPSDANTAECRSSPAESSPWYGCVVLGMLSDLNVLQETARECLQRYNTSHAAAIIGMFNNHITWCSDSRSF